MTFLKLNAMPDPTASQSAFEAGVISLRTEQPADEPFLLELYASTRQAELDLTGWDAATRLAFLNMQFRAMRAGYASTYPKAAFSIILLAAKPIGRQVIDRNDERIRVVDVALLPACRNRGIGTFLMRQVLAEAEQARKLVCLQVLRDSRAFPFYQRLGFRTVGDDGVYLQLEFGPLTAPG
jgi:ribosomal protein S18 acetylase RimI-like enzyme